MAVIFLLHFKILAFSQDTKLTIGVNGSPSFYNLKASKGFDHQYIYDNPKFRSGIDLSYYFYKKSSISTGLFYFRIGYKVDYVFIFRDQGDPLIPKYSEIKTNYLDIPVIYNTTLLSKEKFSIYSSTGIVASILISSFDQTTFENNSVRNSKFSNSFLFSFQLGSGLKYNLSEKFSIKIEPQYRLFFKGFDKLMTQYPSVFNGTFGIIYVLK